MNIHIEPADGVPIYTQVVRQVQTLIASRRLLPGQELPPIRVLAEQLLINPSTVARAYAELERLHIVIKRSTAGTFVADTAPEVARAACRDALVARLDQLLAEAQALGIDLDELLPLLRERYSLLEAAHE
jgi:GntR family transcriptional regulator